MRRYSELIRLSTFSERLDYLRIRGRVGEDTFGFDRYLNQNFYKSIEWKRFRDSIIVRDGGCDMALKDYPITDWVIRGGKPIRPRILVHHLNPLVKEDIIEHSDKLFDPENVVCVSFNTHNMIHYGGADIVIPQKEFVERTPYDTCPWRKGAT